MLLLKILCLSSCAFLCSSVSACLVESSSDEMHAVVPFVVPSFLGASTWYKRLFLEDCDCKLSTETYFLPIYTHFDQEIFRNLLVKYTNEKFLNSPYLPFVLYSPPSSADSCLLDLGHKVMAIRNVEPYDRALISRSFQVSDATEGDAVIKDVIPLIVTLRSMICFYFEHFEFGVAKAQTLHIELLVVFCHLFNGFLSLLYRSHQETAVEELNIHKIYEIFNAMISVILSFEELEDPIAPTFAQRAEVLPELLTSVYDYFSSTPFYESSTFGSAFSHLFVILKVHRNLLDDHEITAINKLKTLRYMIYFLY